MTCNEDTCPWGSFHWYLIGCSSLDNDKAATFTIMQSGLMQDRKHCQDSDTEPLFSLPISHVTNSLASEIMGQRQLQYTVTKCLEHKKAKVVS